MGRNQEAGAASPRGNKAVSALNSFVEPIDNYIRSLKCSSAIQAVSGKGMGRRAAAATDAAPCPQTFKRTHKGATVGSLSRQRDSYCLSLVFKNSVE